MTLCNAHMILRTLNSWICKFHYYYYFLLSFWEDSRGGPRKYCIPESLRWCMSWSSRQPPCISVAWGLTCEQGHQLDHGGQQIRLSWCVGVCVCVCVKIPFFWSWLHVSCRCWVYTHMLTCVCMYYCSSPWLPTPTKSLFIAKANFYSQWQFKSNQH